MYGVTSDGFVTKPFAQIRSDIEDTLRNGDSTLGILPVDPLLDCSDQSPMGQLVATFAGGLAEAWEALAGAYAARYPDSAADSSLDEVASITGSTRDASVKTQVVGQVTLTALTVLPAGSVANLTGRPNDRFVTLADVTAGALGGTYDVTFEAENAGFLEVIAGQLDEIAEPVSGWTAVDNSAGSTVAGTDAETDAALRAKRAAQLALPGSTNVDAIRADLLDLAGVVDARVTEDTVNKTISAVVRGGVAQDIYDAIFLARAGGITSLGTSSGTAVDSQGVSHPEKYTAAAAQDVHADVTVTVDSTFDVTDGPAAIKTAIKTYIDALPISGDVIHDLSKCAAYDVPGVTKVTALLQGIGSPAGSSDIVIGDSEYATADVANIDVTVS